MLDLAFVLPAMMMTSARLWKLNVVGLFFAVPLMTFAATMAAAIIAMSVVMNARGLAESTGVIAVFLILVAVTLDLTYMFLRRMRPSLQEHP